VLQKVQEFRLGKRVIGFRVSWYFWISWSGEAALRSESLDCWRNVGGELSEIDFEIFILVQPPENSIHLVFVEIFVKFVHKDEELVEIYVTESFWI